MLCLHFHCTTARSVPQVSRYIIRFLTLLQLPAHAAQAGLQAGRVVVEQYLDLSVADAEAVRIADGGGEQAQPLVHRQGRVNARLADVGERAGGCGLEDEGNLLWFGWITETLYILSIVILYMRLVGIIGFRHIRHLRNRACVAARCRRCYTENGITRAPVLRKVHISRRCHAASLHQSAEHEAGNVCRP